FGGACRQIARFSNQAQLLLAVSAPRKTDCSAGLPSDLFDPPARTRELLAGLSIRQLVKHAVFEHVRTDFEPRTKVADLRRTHHRPAYLFRHVESAGKSIIGQPVGDADIQGMPVIPAGRYHREAPVSLHSSASDSKMNTIEWHRRRFGRIQPNRAMRCTKVRLSLELSSCLSVLGIIRRTSVFLCTFMSF